MQAIMTNTYASYIINALCNLYLNNPCVTSDNLIIHTRCFNSCPNPCRITIILFSTDEEAELRKGKGTFSPRVGRW